MSNGQGFFYLYSCHASAHEDGRHEVPSDGIVESLAKVLLGEHIVQDWRRSFGPGGARSVNSVEISLLAKKAATGANLHGNTDSGYGARESNDCNDTTVAGLWH